MDTTKEKVVCLVCEGGGKQTVKATTLNEIGWHAEPPIEIDCIWCHGKGNMTPEELQFHQWYQDVWCKCEPGEREDVPVFDEQRQRWDTLCGTCGKALVIG